MIRQKRWEVWAPYGFIGGCATQKKTVKKAYGCNSYKHLLVL